MGYQNLGGSSPRFYIDLNQYASANGLIETWASHAITETEIAQKVWTSGLNPVDTHIATGQVSQHSHTSWIVEYKTDFFTKILGNTKGYFALLNHNLKSLDVKYGVDAYDYNDYSGDFTNIDDMNGSTPDLDGWSIQRFQYSGESHRSFYFYIRPQGESDFGGGEGYRIGGASFGLTYDMPTNPDLRITLGHSYEGLKTIQTKGGSTLSNANYHKPAKWGDREAWQLGDFPYYYSGRRTWSLSWSYVSDTDVEPYSYYGNKWDSDTDGSPTPSEGGDNWFQNVLHYTMGGHLPFIFCPDPSIVYYNDGTNPPRVPEFSICRLDMRSYKRTQISFKTYNIKVKIVESW